MCVREAQGLKEVHWKSFFFKISSNRCVKRQLWSRKTVCQQCFYNSPPRQKNSIKPVFSSLSDFFCREKKSSSTHQQEVGKPKWGGLILNYSSRQNHFSHRIWSLAEQLNLLSRRRHHWNAPDTPHQIRIVASSFCTLVNFKKPNKSSESVVQVETFSDYSDWFCQNNKHKCNFFFPPAFASWTESWWSELTTSHRPRETWALIPDRLNGHWQPQRWNHPSSVVDAD